MKRLFHRLLIGLVSIILFSCLAGNTVPATAATVASKTPDEVVAFLREDMKNNKYAYGAWGCLQYVSDVYGKMGFDTRYHLNSAIDYWHILEQEGKAHYDPLGSVPVGADVFFDAGANFPYYGHIGIYIGNGTIIHNRTLSSTDYGVVEQEIASNSYYTSCYLGWAWHDWVTVTSEVRGSVMSSGNSESVIPDGDYLIVAAGSSDKAAFYYLDIQGTALPAANDTNVAINGPLTGAALTTVPEYELWTLTYGSDGFYTIKQKGTNVCLDVYCADTLQGKNVQVCASNGGNAQKWAIYRNGRNGYRLKAKCSGFSLDVAGGRVDTSGTNVQQFSDNDTDAQSWLFIPYNPSQPIAEGRCVILFGGADGYELDVPGDTGDIENATPVQIWTDNAPSQYNSFELVKLTNGYYKIRHIASGKCLDVTNGLRDYKSKVGLFDDNGSIAQQWAVVSNGTGYSIIARCNGYALDLPAGNTAKGTAIEVYPRLENGNQRWRFVPAEYTVSFDLNGGVSGPENQTKYYNADLELSSVIPERPGYSFVRWDYIALDGTTTFMPGDTITADQDLLLTAVWKSNNYTVSYNGNGGSPVPGTQHSTGAAVVIPSGDGNIPSRPHYHFRGWAESPTAVVAEYAPGDTYSKGVSTTLYAVWERSYEHIFALPAALTVIDDEAFLNTNADVIVVPATVTQIGENAFGDVVIYGFTGSRAESYANEHNLVFVPITSGWVPESEIPSGAHVTNEKWRYTLTTTNTTTSTESSLEGWTQADFEWIQSGTGVYQYAPYPDGIPADHRTYSKDQLPGEKIDGNTRRVAGSPSHKTYIYWHWTLDGEWPGKAAAAGSAINVFISDKYGYDASDGYTYTLFHSFELNDMLGHEGTTTSGYHSVGDNIYSTDSDAFRSYNKAEYVSHWWWRLEVFKQTYTEYVKLFTYVQDESEILESETEVQPGDGISNVQRWVKYGF